MTAANDGSPLISGSWDDALAAALSLVDKRLQVE